MKKNEILKIALMIITLVGIGVGCYFLFRSFGITDVEGLRTLIEKCGAWGWLVYIALFIAVSVFLCAIPGTSATFIIVAIVLFGSWKALIISTIAVLIASSLMFLIGRTFGEKTAEKIVGSESLHKAQELIDVKSKIFLPLMFLFPAFPDDALCMVAGMTKMKYWYFIIIVAICRTIGIATFCFLGSGFIDWASLSIVEWICLINLAIFDIVCVFKLSNKLEQKIKTKKDGGNKNG